MTEVERIVLTAAMTISGSVIVLVLGQLLLRFVLEPLQEFKKAREEALSALIYWGNVYTNPGVRPPDDLVEVSDGLRKCGTALRVTALSIPAYGVLRMLKLVPTRDRIDSASSSLFFLSNALFSGGDAHKNFAEAKRAYEALGYPDHGRVAGA